jgi:hypothetical protein
MLRRAGDHGRTSFAQSKAPIVTPATLDTDQALDGDISRPVAAFPRTLSLFYLVP